jgi:hypothetical protein
MSSNSKIIGMHHDRIENAHEEAPSVHSPFAFVDENEAAIEPLDLVEPYDSQWESSSFIAENTSRHRFSLSTLASSAAFATVVGWTGFFTWTYRSEIHVGILPARIIELVTNWSIPVALVGILWMLAQRNSRAEANRFASTAQLLRDESILLEARMRTVNEEISLARDFLAQNARELESIGKQSADRLTQSAAQLGAALADSDERATKLQDVSNAAASNLEQLRKHLPVVTSVAKDVTNQIGSAGNAAQLQAKSLIASLQRMGQAGDQARASIESMHDHAATAASNISEIVGQSSSALHHQMESATLATDTIVEKLSNATQNASGRLNETALAIGTLLETSSEKFESDAINLHQMVATELGNSGQKLANQMAEVSGVLERLRLETGQQDMHVEAMVQRVQEHVELVGAKIEQLDRMATDRSSSLAFSYQALAETGKEIDATFAGNDIRVDALIAKADHLVLALDTASRELEETLPGAFQRVEGNFNGSLLLLEDARNQMAAFDKSSDDLSAKTATIVDLVQKQQKAVELLLNDQTDMVEAKQQQYEALSVSLSKTRELLDDLSERADNGIIQSLEAIKTGTAEVASQTREIFDHEFVEIADRISEQNRVALASAIDGQVSSVQEMVQGAIQRSLDVSNETTTKLSRQLSQIHDMTSNLERRLALAHESFDGLDDSKFARQMALLTESLNSTAIDVAKILSNEVTDTSWAAYLKGDRGVFTRKAVRLLDAGEARAISVHYSEDAEFHEHVNRYIHDFEAMMRVLLSTRDGNSVGVTVLSSDVGKLYVALAQAIERLRN